jgi:outer membrane protein OmpA-like peptidoglycan-associated protein
VEEKQKKNAPDERVDSYTLFSFAYGTNTPLSGNAEAQRVVEQIKQTLKRGAKVTIVGYTDSRGNPNVNQALSTQRAQSVANAIGFADAQAKGVGATTLNDNRLPEGRFYNRFVQVDVRTPLR